ncbi:hypothetical protein CDL12_25211 [Handroanthus impetiginosus]|uniref:Uncharacterized protein n=1 Tax=Handroanthus impetiginosus TaxID=429701 RepID=A0A2G9GAG2_9LAMI|nr:hypothetical protein CDL12_25211 [Handroanthus impetiginosus]
MEPESVHRTNENAKKNPHVSSPSSSSTDGSLSSSTECISSPDIATENRMQSSSQMKSPPVQTMGQPPGYDPNRIPSSIFSTKPANPTEWSVASNESLFSIHMGNNSFSRDYAILFGRSGEFPRPEEWNNKSGELPRLEEWNNSQSNLRYVSEVKTNELTSLPPSLPPVMEVPMHEETSIKSGELSRNENKSLNIAPASTPAEVVNVPVAAAITPDVKKSLSVEGPLSSPSHPTTFASTSCLSSESRNSSSSFVFPVLVNDSGKVGSLKAVPEKPEQPQSPAKQVFKETANAPESARWCSCFPWWPQCC